MSQISSLCLILDSNSVPIQSITGIGHFYDVNHNSLFIVNLSFYDITDSIFGYFNISFITDLIAFLIHLFLFILHLMNNLYYSNRCSTFRYFHLLTLFVYISCFILEVQIFSVLIEILMLIEGLYLQLAYSLYS